MRRVWLGVVAAALVGAAACRGATPSTTSNANSSTATTAPITLPSSLPRANGFSNASIKLTQVNNVPGAITMAVRPSDDTLYVATQNGQIYAVNPGGIVDPVSARHLVANLNGVVHQNGGEQGLLGMTFSQDGATLYVHYSATAAASVGAGQGDTVVEEYAVTGTGAAMTLGNPRQVLTFPQPQGNHNGGSLLLGPESTTGNDVLYLALGDGGAGNDQGTGHDPILGNGQSLNTLLGKILRFHPLAAGDHTNPSDNPFFNMAPKSPEIWSYGLRNPFRISFDKSTGDLWIADVGQDAREEIDDVAANDLQHPRGKGANFGWNLLEGLIDGPNSKPATRSQTVRPVFDIDHNTNPDCAIIGGYVYRGPAIPDLVGAYVYSDNCNGSIRGLVVGPKSATNRALGASVNSPSSFGEDANGNLYVLSLSDGLLKIEQGP